MPPLIFFDLDGTLAESKQPLTPEMARFVAELLKHIKVAVVSGGALPQFLEQVVGELPEGANLGNLYLEPTSGAALYEYKKGEWEKVYEEHIPATDATLIEKALQEGAKASGVIEPAQELWGPQIEYRGGQVSFSALGQKALPAAKKAWDPSHEKRQALQAAIAPLLPPGYEASMGGATTIDVTRKGVNKAYGIHQLCERLRIKERTALYVGDELRHLGNDEAAFATEIKTRAVDSPADTIALIRELLLA